MAAPSRITTGASSGWNAHGAGRRLATPPTSAAVHCEDDATVGDGPLQDAAVRSSRQIKLRDGHDAAAQGSQPIQPILRHLSLPAVVPEMRPSRVPPLPFDAHDDGVSGDDY